MVKVTLSMPADAAKRLQVQIDNHDPRLAAWMKEQGIIGIGVVLPKTVKNDELGYKTAAANHPPIIVP